MTICRASGQWQCLLSSLCSSSPASRRPSNLPNLTELSSGWKMTSANKRQPRRCPGLASYLRHFSLVRSAAHARHGFAILQENGVYKDLYFGMNLATPGDLWKQDWWYRTTFTAPPGREVYSLIFKGINYRADIWLNGHKVANRATVVGMYNEFEFNVTAIHRARRVTMSWR